MVSKSVISHIGKRALEIKSSQGFTLQVCINRAINENPDVKNSRPDVRRKIYIEVQRLTNRPSDLDPSRVTRRRDQLYKLRSFLRSPEAIQEAMRHESALLAGLVDP